MGTRTLLHYLWICAVGLCFTAPLAIWGFCPGDQAHLFWAKRFSDQLWSGDLYPRWLEGMNSGLGSPTFYFYGPVTYYITAGFHKLLQYSAYGWPAVGWSAALASVASGWAAYLWLRTRCTAIAAVAGATVFVALPYHQRVDYLERFAFAEYWSFVWMPLVLYFVARRSVPGIAASYALLVMTHPPVALMFAAIPLAYGVVTRSIRQTAAGVALGIGLAAVYLAPALATQSNVSMAAMLNGHGHYASNFLFQTPPLVTTVPQEYLERFLVIIGWITVLTTVIAAVSFLAGKRSLRERSFWMAVVVFLTFLMTAPSDFVWRLAPILQKVQFPWRAQTIISVAVAALIAFAVDGKFRRFALAGTALLLVAFGYDAALQIGVRLRDPGTVGTRMLVMDYGEYRPRWVPEQWFSESGIQELAQSPPEEIAPGQVRLARFYYPTLRVLTEDGAECATSPSPEGLLVAHVPEGKHAVEVKTGADRAVRLGGTVSAISLVVFLAMVLYPLRGRVAPSSERERELGRRVDRAA